MTIEKRTIEKRTIGTRDETYLVTRNEQIAPADAGPLDFDWVVEQMNADPAITVEATLRPRNLALQSFGSSVVQEVLVATMPPAKAEQLAAHPQMVLEPDGAVFLVFWCEEDCIKNIRWFRIDAG